MFFYDLTREQSSIFVVLEFLMKGPKSGCWRIRSRQAFLRSITILVALVALWMQKTANAVGDIAPTFQQIFPSSKNLWFSRFP